jgi:DNA (cytosine-5)-methyltransferase 1
VLDLFSGIGGFSLGLERAGMKTVAFCEVDPYCRRVLAKHWPEVPILDDIRTAHFPDADIIVGGFPCQDVSRAGKRAGITGERSGLYRELVRAIRVVRPKYAILENVAALLGNGMGDVLGDLAEGGDCVEWDCVPACALGAPHQRDRIWIVAHADSERRGETRQFRHRPKQVPNGRIETHDASGATSIGCEQGRTRRFPDSFAGVRDATRRDITDADIKGLAERKGEFGHTQQEQQAVKRDTHWDVWQSQWPSEPALLGVDDGISNRVDCVRALGNSFIPQIPEMIGRAIMEAAQ